MDDICLTRCEGTSFDEPTDLSVSGGMAVNEPSMALQGDYCRLLLSGKTLELSGPMLEPGLYTLSFFVKGPDAESAACAFPIDVAMSGEAYAPELVLADQWKNITVSFSVEEASELSATIGMEGLTAVILDLKMEFPAGRNSRAPPLLPSSSQPLNHIPAQNRSLWDISLRSRSTIMCRKTALPAPDNMLFQHISKPKVR